MDSKPAEQRSFAERHLATYVALWVSVSILFIASWIAVQQGQSGLRFMGSRLSFTQYSTYQLYKIDDTLAFEVQNERVAVVSYEKTSGLYALAGQYQHAPVERPGSVFMPSADYRQGDYVYSAYPAGQTTIVNMRTRETVGAQVPAAVMAERGWLIEVSQLPAYRERGLTAAEEQHLTPALIAAQYPPLPTYNENLFVVQMAYYLVFAVLLMGGIPFVIFYWRRSREKAKEPS